jgi:hypothetical protein
LLSLFSYHGKIATATGTAAAPVVNRADVDVSDVCGFIAFPFPLLPRRRFHFYTSEVAE